MPRTLVAVYWGARRETLDACAQRTLRHFEALAGVSEHLGRWHKLGRRKPSTDRPVDVTSGEVVTDLLAAGVNRTDIGREVIPELGWSMSLWNGDAGGWSASVRIHCGLYSRVRGLSNAAYVSVNDDAGSAFSTADAEALLARWVQIWTPDRGVVERSDGAEPAVELAVYAASRSLEPLGWLKRR
jgi:hypothetical protein